MIAALDYILLRVRIVWARLICALFGSLVFHDKYGARYRVWADTRLGDTLARGVRTDDDGVLLHLRDIVQRYRDANRPAIVLDVGAYIGVVTVTMAGRAPADSRFFAFEPLARNYRRLCENIALNGFGFVTPFNQAVGGESGQATLALTHNPGGNFLDLGRADLRELKGATGETQTVPVTTLAEIARAQSLDRIDVLKTDAEFQDLNVLRGAGALAAEGRIHYIVSEFHGAEDAPLTDQLRAWGYQVYYIVRRRKELVADLARYPGDTPPCLNILAISPRAPYDAAALSFHQT